jgi:hypothetical protein
MVSDRSSEAVGACYEEVLHCRSGMHSRGHSYVSPVAYTAALEDRRLAAKPAGSA